MLENVELNNARDRIVAINAAVGGFRGSTKVPVDPSLPEVEGIDALNRYDNRWEYYAEIPVIMLEDTIELMEDPYLIKLDCESCEYEVLRSSLDPLKRFRVILLNIIEDTRSLLKSSEIYISAVI